MRKLIVLENEDAKCERHWVEDAVESLNKQHGAFTIHEMTRREQSLTKSKLYCIQGMRWKCDYTHSARGQICAVLMNSGVWPCNYKSTGYKYKGDEKARILGSTQMPDHRTMEARSRREYDNRNDKPYRGYQTERRSSRESSQRRTHSRSISRSSSPRSPSYSEERSDPIDLTEESKSRPVSHRNEAGQ